MYPPPPPPQKPPSQAHAQPHPFMDPHVPTNHQGYYDAPPPMVMTSQPPTVVMVQQPVYKDYIGLSIMNMLCCCFPLGLTALIFSVQTREAFNRQDTATGHQHSHASFILNMVALAIGICFHIAWIAYVIYYSVTISNAVSSYYG